MPQLSLIQSSLHPFLPTRQNTHDPFHQMHNAILKKTAPRWMHHAFPAGNVPIASLDFFQPQPNAPLCYLLDATQLSDNQCSLIAQSIYDRWHPECRSITEALDYLSYPGLPLSLDHFDGVESVLPPIEIAIVVL